jgi:hypothetical protein
VKKSRYFMHRYSHGNVREKRKEAKDWMKQSRCRGMSETSLEHKGCVIRLDARTLVCVERN